MHAVEKHQRPERLGPQARNPPMVEQFLRPADGEHAGQDPGRLPTLSISSTLRWTSSTYSSQAPADSSQVSAGVRVFNWLKGLGCEPLSVVRERYRSVHSA